MDTPRPCGCKGVRTCLVCEKEFGVVKRDFELSEKCVSYVYCPLCKKAWKGWNTDILAEHPNHDGDSIDYPGVYIELDFLSSEEQEKLIQDLDCIPWDLSQSGRRKQNYGPKCNFKKRKIKVGDFNGFPQFSKFIQNRFKNVALLEGFQTVEQCSLEYTPEKGASIDPHVDDCWVWGERVVTVNVIGDSVLTLSHYHGGHERYNLADVPTYPRVLNEEGRVIWKPTCDDIEKDNDNNKEMNTNLVVFNNVLGSEDCKSTELDQNRSLFTNSHGCNDKINRINEDSSTICSKDKCSSSYGTFESHTFLTDKNDGSYPIVRVPMPARSLLVIYGPARYDWEHSVLRDDITKRRVCLAYREFTPPFLKGGVKEAIGSEIICKAQNFW